MELNLKDEEEIVWLKKPRNYRYLRETHVEVIYNNGEPEKYFMGHLRYTGQLIAYANLRPGAEKHRSEYWRRIWVHFRDDWADQNHKGLPAVDPFSIKIGKPSLRVLLADNM